MNAAIVLCVLSMAVMVFSRPEESKTKFPSRYDGVNVDEILGNKKLLVPYVNCLLDKGKCAPDGKELKGHMKEALETGCEPCTDAQKAGAKKVIKHLINHEKDSWKELSAKYDPDNKYSSKYEKELEEIKKE